MEEQEPVFYPRLPRPQRLGAGRIPNHFKTTQLLAQQMSVQQRRKSSIGIASTRRREKMAEVQEQTQGVKLRQNAARVVPFFYEFPALPPPRKKGPPERRRT